jgi:hypothetical protein
MRVSFSSSQGRGRSFEDERYEFLPARHAGPQRAHEAAGWFAGRIDARSRNVSWRTCGQFARENATAIRSRLCQ